MFEIESKIRKWADDRGLIAATTIDRQFDKLEEEFNELELALLHEDKVEIMDALGDMFVVMANMAYKLGVSMQECVMLAYDEIKDRKGKIVDGTFVKE